MRIAVMTTGIVAAVFAFLYLGQAMLTPIKYSLSTATAPQLTQVYSEGAYNAALASALFLLVGVCALIYHHLTPLYADPGPDA